MSKIGKDLALVKNMVSGGQHIDAQAEQVLRHLRAQSKATSSIFPVSNAKIEGTGFKPKYSLDLGIADLIKGYTMIKNTKYGNV